MNQAEYSTTYHVDQRDRWGVTVTRAERMPGYDAPSNPVTIFESARDFDTRKQVASLAEAAIENDYLGGRFGQPAATSQTRTDQVYDAMRKTLEDFAREAERLKQVVDRLTAPRPEQAAPQPTFQSAFSRVLTLAEKTLYRGDSTDPQDQAAIRFLEAICGGVLTRVGDAFCGQNGELKLYEDHGEWFIKHPYAGKALKYAPITKEMALIALEAAFECEYRNQRAGGVQ